MLKLHQRRVYVRHIEEASSSSRWKHNIERRITKLENVVQRLHGVSRDLNRADTSRNEDKAAGSGISLLGGVIGFMGVVAAPVTGGLSLAATGASTALSVGGSIKASNAASGLQSDTNYYMDRVNTVLRDLKETKKEIEKELEDKFGKLESLLEFFKCNNISKKILDFTVKIKETTGNVNWEQAYSLTKVAFETAKSLAQFIIVVKAQPLVVRSVLSIHFLFTKSEILLQYIPQIIFGRALQYQAVHHLAHASMVIKSGGDVMKVSKAFSQETQKVGNLLIQSRHTRIAGTLQKTTVSKTVGTVSKLGVGLSIASIALDTYSLFSALGQSKTVNPKAREVVKLASDVSTYIEDIKKLKEDLEKKRSDVCTLHNELLILVEETIYVTTGSVEEDKMNEILEYLEKSQKVFGSP